MTDIVGALRNKSGKILASFREIPVVSVERAMQLKEKLQEKA